MVLLRGVWQDAHFSLNTALPSLALPRFTLANGAAALLGFDLPPRRLVATATASALLVDAARVPIYLYVRGAAIAGAVPVWVIACVGVTIGTFIGVPILGRIPASAYRPLVGALLLVLGLSMFLAAL
jgi:uncharacterized membrane protein YfcA